MSALTVEAALARILDDVAPLETEPVPLERAAGRVLAAPLLARLTQPPFAASAMDGYAVRAGDVVRLQTTLEVIGEAAAGRGFRGSVGPGQAVRIFTGAPVPAGADAIVIQENTEQAANLVTIRQGEIDPGYIRPRGFDFTGGQRLLEAGRRIGAREITLAAAAGHDRLEVHRQPRVAILATGDELVPAGTIPGQDQIVCSNTHGIAAMVKAAGGAPQLLGIAGDTRESLDAHVAKAGGADILVTVGGASVGDHDLVAPVLQARGMQLDFWKILMRPGKPLMFGRLGQQRVLGLPGNPVSALICTRVFLLPLLARLTGHRSASEMTSHARLSVALPANGPRQHYMRAITEAGPDGSRQVRPVRSQDSSLLSPLAEADCLIVRAPGATAAPAGANVAILPINF